MTQKELADKLGIVPKTVSKWETGNGFVDVSMLSMLAEILGVSEKTLLTGNMNENSIESGNIARTKFFVSLHFLLFRILFFFRPF
jgi:transcriptional regulator with XRE-family HTH domain